MVTIRRGTKVFVVYVSLIMIILSKVLVLNAFASSTKEETTKADSSFFYFDFHYENDKDGNTILITNLDDPRYKNVFNNPQNIYAFIKISLFFIVIFLLIIFIIYKLTKKNKRHKI